MSNSYKKIMLVTNEPSDSIGAELTALNLARVNNASVLLVDTIRTPFHAPRYQSLSTEMMFETAVSAKSAYLEKIRGRFAQAGVNSSCKVMISPRTSAELIQAVIENECDLVIRYMKGQSSRAAGRFGETAVNLMRACTAPVLLTQSEIETPKVLACINLDHGKEENSSIVNHALQLAGNRNNLFVLSCWGFAGNEFSFDYMDNGLVAQTKAETAGMYVKLFDNVKADNGFSDDQAILINENPTTCIPQFCSKYSIDVAVACSASLNHPVGRKLGTTIERTISNLPCALLTVKPIGFEGSENNSSRVKQTIKI